MLLLRLLLLYRVVIVRYVRVCAAIVVIIVIADAQHGAKVGGERVELREREIAEVDGVQTESLSLEQDKHGIHA